MSDRLTNEGAWAILAAPLSVPIAELAKTWNVSGQTVRIYKRLENAKARDMANLMRERGDPVHLLPAANKERRGSLTDDQVRAIRSTDKPSEAMAEEIGCSASMVRMIRTGRTYIHVKD